MDSTNLKLKGLMTQVQSYYLTIPTLTGNLLKKKILVLINLDKNCLIPYTTVY